MNIREALGPGGEFELIGRGEAAKEIGTKSQNLLTLKGLPDPVVKHLPRRPLWLASEIREFAASRRPQEGSEL